MKDILIPDFSHFSVQTCLLFILVPLIKPDKFAPSGLASIHNLTARSRMSLRVDLRDGDESVFAQYSTFEVAKRNYKLTVGGYSGTAGNTGT